MINDASRQVRIIMYHYVRELPYTRYPRINGLLVSQFKEQLRFLKDRGSRFLSMQELEEAVCAGGAVPENSVLLTFDDGYLDHYTNVFPILESMGIPAFFSMPGKIIAEKQLLAVNRIHFILASAPIDALVASSFEFLDRYRGTEFELPSNEELYQKLAVASRFDNADTIYLKRLLQVELPEHLRQTISSQMFEQFVGVPEESFVGELYMSMDEVRLMSRHNMAWGIHGYDHCWMNKLTPPELERDIRTALDVFDGVVPPNGWYCCYPYGSISDEVVACAKRFGAGGGFTTEVRSADLTVDSKYALPRWDTNDVPPKSGRAFE